MGMTTARFTADTTVVPPRVYYLMSYVKSSQAVVMFNYGHRLRFRCLQATTKSWERSKSAACRHVGYVGPSQLPCGDG
jgi:hypothetical protein